MESSVPFVVVSIVLSIGTVVAMATPWWIVSNKTIPTSIGFFHSCSLEYCVFNTTLSTWSGYSVVTLLSLSMGVYLSILGSIVIVWGLLVKNLSQVKLGGIFIIGSGSASLFGAISFIFMIQVDPTSFPLWGDWGRYGNSFVLCWFIGVLGVSGGYLLCRAVRRMQNEERNCYDDNASVMSEFSKKHLPPDDVIVMQSLTQKDTDRPS